MNEIKKQGQEEDTVGRGEDSDGAALQDRDQGPVQQREQETGRQAGIALKKVSKGVLS